MEIFTGQIIVYDTSRGFGFIRRIKGRDVYFSLDDFVVDCIPQEGKNVTFSIIKTKKGNRAKNINILK